MQANLHVGQGWRFTLAEAAVDVLGAALVLAEGQDRATGARDTRGSFLSVPGVNWARP